MTPADLDEWDLDRPPTGVRPSSPGEAIVRYRRTPIEIESPEQLGYDTIKNNLAESSFSDMSLAGYGIDADVTDLLLPYADHLGLERLRRIIAGEGPQLRPDDVLVTAGAASALFIAATSLLDVGDHVLALRAELRHQPRNPARDRGRAGDPRAPVRGRLEARPRPPRRTAASRDASRERDVPAQSDGRDGSSRRSRRACLHGGGAPDSSSPRRRDVPRTRVRRGATHGGVTFRLG